MIASEEDWERYAPKVIADVMALAIQHGGTISGEHGIGATKKQFMPLVFSPHDIAIMQQIKTMVDPNHILNTGKIFDA